MRFAFRVGVAGLLAALSSDAPALAGIAQTTLPVTASVGNNCTIAATPAALGAYDPVGANATASLAGTGGLVVTCTVGASTTISLDQGRDPAPGSTVALPIRRMTHAENALVYALYQDAAHTRLWGASAATSEVYVGTGTPSTLVVYATVPGGQNVPAGAYSDSVLAQINF
jgi:spore coat protein U-like protein